MYYKCMVKISEDDLKEYLSNYYNEEEISEMTPYDLQNETTDIVSSIVGDFFSDYQVIDENTLVVGEF